MKLAALLNTNKQLLSAYVYLGTKVVEHTIIPLDMLLKHLLEIQGLDPTISPQNILINKMSHLFDNIENIKNNSDRFLWAQKQFDKTKQKFPNINYDKFLTLTNLEKMNDPSQNDMSSVKLPNISHPVEKKPSKKKPSKRKSK